MKNVQRKTLYNVSCSFNFRKTFQKKKRSRKSNQHSIIRCLKLIALRINSKKKLLHKISIRTPKSCKYMLPKLFGTIFMRQPKGIQTVWPYTMNTNGVFILYFVVYEIIFRNNFGSFISKSSIEWIIMNKVHNLTVKHTQKKKWFIFVVRVQSLLIYKKTKKKTNVKNCLFF